MPKLLYVDAIVKQFGRKPPVVTGGELDRPLSELDITLARWCRMRERGGRKKIVLPDIIDEDLSRLFPDSEGDPATAIFQSNSRQLVHNVHDWTGVSRNLLNSLVYELSKRVKALGLKVETSKQSDRIVSLTAFVTTLAMNYQYTGKFVNIRGGS